MLQRNNNDFQEQQTSISDLIVIKLNTVQIWDHTLVFIFLS